MEENGKEWRYAVKEGASKDHAEWIDNRKGKNEKRKTTEADTMISRSW